MADVAKGSLKGTSEVDGGDAIRAKRELRAKVLLPRPPSPRSTSTSFEQDEDKRIRSQFQGSEIEIALLIRAKIKKWCRNRATVGNETMFDGGDGPVVPGGR